MTSEEKIIKNKVGLAASWRCKRSAGADLSFHPHFLLVDRGVLLCANSNELCVFRNLPFVAFEPAPRNPHPRVLIAQKIEVSGGLVLSFKDLHQYPH